MYIVAKSFIFYGLVKKIKLAIWKIKIVLYFEVFLWLSIFSIFDRASFSHTQKVGKNKNGTSPIFRSKRLSATCANKRQLIYEKCSVNRILGEKLYETDFMYEGE